MMKMAQPMERGTLANPRINRQNFGKGLKVGVLQLQVLASALSLSILAVPRIAERIPPRVNRGIQRLAGKKAFKKDGHGLNAFLAAG